MKEKIRKFMEAISTNENSPETVDHIIRFAYNAINRWVDYFVNVFYQVIGTETDRALWNIGSIDGEELRRRTEERDNSRRKAHNLAIQACAQINRLCDKYGIEKICPETDDRHVVAEFIGQFIQEIYQDGITNSGHSFDDAFEYAKEHGLPKTNSDSVKEYVEAGL